jgi:glycine/D-amino acid oxidase-like deaminating enzyme
MTPRSRQRHIAVLGAGMLGSTLSIFLARKGARVTLFDAADRPMSKAGRWNEGKLHLGYMYAADRSLNTARKLMPGGIAFRSTVESLIECPIEPHLTRAEEIFLTHAASVVDPDSMFRYLNAVWDLGQGVHGDLNRPTSLTREELLAISENPLIVAGFRVPERSVNTNWLADRLVDRLASERGIELRCSCFVTSVSNERTGWRVSTDRVDLKGFDAVVNALWEGKSAVDETVVRSLSQPLSYRYRASVFMKGANASVNNVVITTGPFGDIKNYDDNDLYLSWYPAGLLLDCCQTHAPSPPTIDRAMENDICRRMIDELSKFFPVVNNLAAAAEEMVVRGGWVVAHGSGVLSDPSSTLHRRDEFGISRLGSYYSVNVGKYSVAPWIASQIAAELA